jgi:hypothetical protein
MLLRHSLLRRKVAEEMTRPLIVTAHAPGKGPDARILVRDNAVSIQNSSLFSSLLAD